MLFQIFGIEAVEFGEDESAVFSDEDIVEVDLTAAVFGRLDTDEIPMDSRLVAVEGGVVCHTRGKVEAARDLFIKECIFHRFFDIRIDTEREFADITCAFVRIEYLVDLFCIISRCFDNFALGEGQRDVLICRTLINSRGIVRDGTFDRIAYRGGVDFAVGDIAEA